MRKHWKKGIASILAAALIFGAMPFYADPLHAEDEQSEVNPILYPLTVHTSTEPAWPVAWDDDTAWDDYQDRFLPELPDGSAVTHANSFVYASTAMLDAFSLRKNTTTQSSYYVGKEADIYHELFTNGINGLADKEDHRQTHDGIAADALSPVTGGSLTYAELHGGTPMMVADLLCKWRPDGVKTSSKLVDAYEVSMSTETGENSEVKYWVRNYGAAAVEMNGASDEFYQEKNNVSSYYRNSDYTPVLLDPKADFWTKTSPQYALIVGWDDDFPKNEFRNAPKNNGAWLMKNTLSSELPFSDYFWVSYEDKGLSEKATVYVRDATKSLRSDCNYYYDNQYHEVRQLPGGTTLGQQTNKEEIRVANVYKIRGTQPYQYVDAVSFYYDPEAEDPGKEAAGTSASQNNKPEKAAASATVILRKTDNDGAPCTSGDDTLLTTVTFENIHGRGHYTIPMKQKVILENGESYAVEIQLDYGTVALEAGNQNWEEVELVKEDGEKLVRQVPETDAQGNPKTDDEGNPVMKDEPVKGPVYDNPLRPEAGCNAGESFYYTGDKNGANTGEWKDLSTLKSWHSGSYRDGYSYGNFCINLLTTETSVKTPYTELNSSDYSFSMNGINNQVLFRNEDFTPEVTVKKKDGSATLSKNTDYHVVYVNNFDASDPNNQGDARVYVIGAGSYVGVLSAAFTILPIDLSGVKYDETPQPIPAEVELEDTSNLVYDRTPKHPAVKKVWLPAEGEADPHVVSSIYYEPVYGEGDQNINASKETEPDAPEVYVRSKATTKNYLNRSATNHFAIKPVDIKNASISLSPEQYSYTGDPITPSFKVMWGQITLTEGKDYTYTYENNVEVGEAYIVVTGVHNVTTGKGNYYGTLKKRFSIVGEDINKATITLSQSVFVYNRKEQKPKVTVKFGNTELKEDRDFSLLFPENCTDVGMKYFFVQGLDPQFGRVQKSFEIIPKDIASDPPLKLEITGHYSYTGEPVIPQYSLKWDDYELQRGTEYTAEVTGNTDVTLHAKVTVTGKGNYTGTLSEEFIINKRDISPGTLTISPSVYEETGSEIDPGINIKVYVNGRKLERGTDFVVYLNGNRRPGTASVTVVGRENYEGSLSGSFTVAAAQSESGGSSGGNSDGGSSSQTDVPDTVLIGGESVPLSDSGEVVAAKQSVSVKSFFDQSFKKYAVFPKSKATISGNGVLTAKKAGEVTLVAYKKSGGKWVPVEAVSVQVDVPTFTQKKIKTDEETVSVAGYLDTEAEPTKWTVSNKKIATIDPDTGELTFKKKGTVKVTAVFGSGSKAAKYKVKVTKK